MKILQNHNPTRNRATDNQDSSASGRIVYRLTPLFSVDARLPPDQGIRKIALNKCADRRGVRGRRAMVSVHWGACGLTVGATMDVPETWRSAAMSKIPKLSARALLSSTAIILASIASTFTAHAAESTPALRQIASIDLPGPPGKRFDYLVIDYDDGWLFSAHLAANQTYVIDLTSNRVLNTVRDTPGAEGLEYVPDERKVYTSNASDNTVGVIDLKTMSVARKIPTEGKPDGSTYATPVHKLYVSDERAKAVALIDVRTDKILTTLHFDSETGVPLYDPNPNWST